MKEFFSLFPTASTNGISSLEKIIPIIITIILVTTIFIIKKHIKKQSNIDKTIRITLCILSGSFLIMYYYLLWSTYGITASTLPLHLCFISNILSLVLCIFPNNKLCNFVLFTGVLGGASSLIFPDLQLSSHYFRYYQFMVCHISIIIIPLYIALIYSFIPKFKDTLMVFIYLNFLGIPIGIFNELYKTNYMFISFTSSFAADGSLFIDIIGTKHYFILLELLVFFAIFTMYLFIFLIDVFKLLILNGYKKTTYIKA